MLNETFSLLLAEGASNSGALSQFLIFIPLFGLMYFLIIRPQKQKQKQLQEMLNTLKAGDKVLTNGGAIGIITRVSEKTVRICLGEHTEVEFVRSAVANIITDDKVLSDEAQAK